MNNNNANLSLGRQEKKNRRQDRCQFMREEDEELVYKQATTTKERTSIGSTNAKKNSGLEPMTTEEVQLSLVLLATTKESVTGTTTNERRTVDWIDDAGLSLELADEEDEERRLDRRVGLSLEARR